MDNIKKRPVSRVRECLVKRARQFVGNEDGFNLIEIAIGLFIIGILLGGILKGQELLENARLKSIITQSNQYRLAITTFMDRYEALPGDFSHATDLLGAGVTDGNGNSLIDGDGLAPQGEAVAFWAHLAAAQLIPSPGRTDGAGASFGAGAPACKFGGGFTVCSNPHQDMQGHWLVVGKQRAQRGDGALLTPAQAHHLVTKTDGHGLATTGAIQARDGGDVPPGSCVKADGSFNLSNKSPACVLYIQF